VSTTTDIIETLGREELRRRFANHKRFTKPLQAAVDRMRQRVDVLEMDALRWIEEHEDAMPEPIRSWRREARQLRADIEALNPDFVALWERYIVRGEEPEPEEAA